MKVPTVRGNLGSVKLPPVAPSLEGHGLIARETSLAQVYKTLTTWPA